MSWSDIFKTKSKAKADPRIRWFGKLPTYPDYYSSHADETWAVEFNEWILKGFELYQTRLQGAQARVNRLPVTRCAVRLPKSGMTVFATVLDFGGDMRGRPFPLCFYVGVPTSQWPGPRSDNLAGALQAVRDLAALRREVPRFINSPGRFETVFGDRKLDLQAIADDGVDDSWLALAKAIPLLEWFAGAEDQLKIKDVSTWVRAVTSWGDNLAKLDGKTFEPTLRFPLAKRCSINAQIAGWICWLEARMRLTDRMLSLMMSGDLDEETGHLTVIARSLVPDDFLLMTPLAGTLPYLDDLAKTDGEGSGSQGEWVDPNGAELSTTGSWVDFVQSAPAAS